MNINIHRFRNLIILVICFFYAGIFYAQDYDIIGAPATNTGVLNTYTVLDNSNNSPTGLGYTFTWVTDGTIFSSDGSINYGNTYSGSDLVSVYIVWSSAGTKTVDVEFEDDSGDDYYYYTIYPTVTGSTAPDTPTAPTIQSTNCGHTILERVAPPSGVTWYWQSSATGTSTTSANSANTITRTSGSIYYLRAKNSNNVWSVGASSIDYTIDYPSTWYADTDSDGFGNPNITQSSCTQPTGYVNNNTDECLAEFGINNGCPTTTGTNAGNYIRTTQPQIGVTDIDVLNNDQMIETISYFDELGRGKQNIAIRGGGNSEDIITHIEYDHIGRITQDFLPYATTSTNGTYKTSALSETESFYNTTKYENTLNPYSEKHLESSPLSRVLEQAAPGTDWALNKNTDTDHTIKFEYTSNTAANAVRLYEADVSGLIIKLTTATNTGDSFYDENTLYKTTTKDENWTIAGGANHTTEEYKNKQGQVVLKRTYATVLGVATAHDTYYIYDDYGNLTFVVSPKVVTSNGVSDDELKELCYQYKYDYRNRLIEKQIPGKGIEYIVYDKLDRPVLTQDANLRNQNKWLFSKYDAFGRIVYTGVYEHAIEENQLEMQAILDTYYTAVDSNGNPAYTLYETKVKIGTGVQTSYYSDESFPTENTGVNLELLTVNYYDDYVALDINSELTIPTSIYEQPVTEHTKSLPTGSKIKILDTNDWITTITAYDKKSRPIWIGSYNEYLETTDVVKIELDFVGKTNKTVSIHNKAGQEQIVIADVFEYDHTGRLLSQVQKSGFFEEELESQYILDGSETSYSTNYTADGSITLSSGFVGLPGFEAVIVANNDEELIVLNNYDALGQLESKKVGGSVASEIKNSAGLQTVDYTYNIRGWLKGINGNANPDDLFNFGLNYNNPTSGTALYNGNISQTSWSTLNNDPSTKTYDYTYDALNRITAAIGANTNHYDLDLVSYDKNGNILNLKRRGHLNESVNSFGMMDDLSYSYDSGNKLTKVVDNGNDTYGFKDGTNTNNDYIYDSNGNMTNDSNKGASIYYNNHLNLPTTVSFSNLNDSDISYKYAADGTKIEKTVSEDVDHSGNNYVVTTTTYAGNYIYKNNKLQFFSQPEGYVKLKEELDISQGFDYVYQYKDHLGNVRLSYADSDRDGYISDALMGDGFESKSGWTSANSPHGGSITEFDSNFKHSGKYSAKIVKETNTSELYVHSNTWIPIDNTTAANYIISAWVYSDNPTADLFLFMNTNEETGYNTAVSSVRSTTINQWVYLEKTISVAANIDKLNIRIDNNGGGTVWFDDVRLQKEGTEIVEENNYYPFGLRHKGYNEFVSANGNSSAQKFKLFQDQKLDDELGLNWYSFKYRNYDPEIARFFNVDPLAEDYVYNGTYNFSENRVIDAVELEGLEKVLVVDKDKRPDDDGTKGKTYSAEIYHLNEETGDVNGPYEGSTYPNSKSNSDNSTNANTLNEGDHEYNNSSGHKGGTKKGLNIVNSAGDRKAPGTTPSGTSKEMTTVNVHAGQSDNGNFNSRGSEGCVTCNPSDSKAFFKNFDFSSNTSKTKGNSTGTITIHRGSDTSNFMKKVDLRMQGMQIKRNNQNVKTGAISTLR